MAGQAHSRIWDLTPISPDNFIGPDGVYGREVDVYNPKTRRVERRWTGPYTKEELAVQERLAAARRDFRIEIDRVARLMCEEMGVDPEELVRVPIEDIHLPDEKASVLPYLKKTAEFENRLVSARMWETMRPHAAVALAGFRAVNRYFLSEK